MLFGKTIHYYMNHFKIIMNFAKVYKQSFVASDLKHYFEIQSLNTTLEYFQYHIQCTLKYFFLTFPSVPML